MKHKFLLLYSWFVRVTLFFFPDIPLVMRFRGFLYGVFMNDCGKNFQVAHNVILNTLENIIIGNNVYIAPNSMIMAGSKKNIIFKDNILIGPYTIIINCNHTYIDKSVRFGGTKCEDILIYNEVWISSHCIILGGSVINNNTIIAANSMVNKPLQKCSIYGGSPVRFIKDNI